VGVPVGVGVAVGEPLAEGDGVGDGELDGVDGSALGVAGAVTVEEGSGEPEGTGVPVAGAGWLVSDAFTSTGAAGGGAAASAIPATIATRPPDSACSQQHGGPVGGAIWAGFGPVSCHWVSPCYPPKQPAGPRHRW